MNEQDYLITATAIRTEMYSDNVLSGADSVAEAFKKQEELIRIFRRENFNVRK